LKSHFPKFNIVIAIGFFAIIPRDFIREYGYGLERFRVFVNGFVESLPESTRTFPKFNVIFLAFSEKLPKFVEDDRHVDLIQMGLGIEYLLSCMNGVSDDNDFRDVCFVANLVNTASNSEKFCFCAGDKGCMMNHLDQRLVMYVDIQD